MKKISFLLILLCLAGMLMGQVTEYSFSSEMGTYTPVVSGTQLIAANIDDGSSPATAIGFDFMYNDIIFTQFVANSNGNIRLGSAAPTSQYTPISTTTNTNAISFFSRDGRAGDAVVYELTGTAPNRVLTIDYPNYKPVYNAESIISAQIKLYETTNVIEIIYGSSNILASTTGQVGLRGSSTLADFSNRSTIEDWNATIAGATSSASCTLSPTLSPANGLTFRWTPPLPSAPNPANLVGPTNEGTGVSVSGLALSWSSGGNLPTGYRLSFGTNNPPSNIIDDLDVENVTTYQLTNILSYSTTYFWQVVPYNAEGTATNCPVWSFTTMGDPTVELPYFQDFVSATFPPLNWERKKGELTTNTVFESNTSTWGRVATFANITGNHPGAKINLYNERKEWLMTPPLNLGDGSTTYQLEFDAALTGYNNNNLVNFGVTDEFHVVISTDNGVTWSSDNILFTRNAENPLNNQANSFIVSLSGYTGIAKIGFYGRRESGTAPDIDLHIANVMIREVPETPIFSITPENHDFGQIIVNSVQNQEFTISNIGVGQLAISGISIEGDSEFTLVNENTSPIIIDSMQNIQFTVVYAPLTEGSHSTVINITEENTRQVHTVAIQGSSFVPAPGSTVSNPHLVTLPIVDYQDNTEAYGNYYNSNMLVPTSSYLNGYDYVAKFTLDVASYLSGSVAGSWTGLLIVAQEPSLEVPAPVLASATGNTGGSFSNVLLPAGDYYAIVSTFPSPDYTDFTLNISAVAAPTTPEFVVTPEDKDFGIVAINTVNDQLFTISNAGGGVLSIASITIEGSDFFILTDMPESFPVELQLNENETFKVRYNPTVVGEHSAVVTITETNGTIRRVSSVQRNMRNTYTIDLSGECYDPTQAIPYTQDFDGEGVTNLSHISWTGDMNILTNHGTNGSKGLSKNIWSSTTTAFAVTCPIGPVTSDTELRFDYRIVNYGSFPNNPTTIVEGDSVNVYVSSNGTDFSLIHSINNSNHITSTEFANITVSLADYDNDIVFVKFRLTYGAGDYYVNIDNFIVEDNTTPVVFNPPTNLAAVAGDQTVNLTWNAPADLRNISGYKVYRDNNPVSTIVTETNYTDTELVNGTTYEYYVTAVYTNPDGESEPSDTVQATPQAGTSGPALPVRNLTASIDANNVMLNWEEPGYEFSHSNGIYNNSIGLNAEAVFTVAQRFSPAQLQEFEVAGQELIKVSFMTNYATAEYTVKVWTGGNGGNYNPGTEILSQYVGTANEQEWVHVILNTPVTIPVDQELWIGYEINTPGGFPAAVSAGPAINGFGNLIYTADEDGVYEWTTLSDISTTLNFNWIIKGLAQITNTQVAYTPIETPEVNKLSRTKKTVFNSNFTTAGDDVNTEYIGNTTRNNRNITGYRVYRNDELLSDVELSQTFYLDTELENGEYTYAVVAVYGNEESDSEEVTVNIHNDVILPPSNLTASVSNRNVTLNWTPYTASSGWFTHTLSDEPLNGIGNNQPGTITVAQRFTAAQLATLGVATSELTKVSIMPSDEADFTIKVWIGGSQTAHGFTAGTLVHEQALPNYLIGSWNEVVLSESITIPHDEEIWIGYTAVHQGVFAAGVDAGPALNGYGNLIQSGGWTTLSSLNPQLDFNWQIKAYAESNGRAVVLSDVNLEYEDIILPSVKSNVELAVVSKNLNTARDRDFIGYIVYRGNNTLTPNPITSLTYTDSNVAYGTYTYKVVAVYDGGESVPAEIVVVVDTSSETDLTVTPLVTELSGNYPNPFNPETVIKFSVAQDGPVSLEIYNVKGQLVKSLLNDNFKTGTHQVVWKGIDDNGRQVGSGIYFYRMKSGKYTATRKMILMK